ncbi:hypothetical protein [Atlantibacter hermannii]|uniref:hypothetical protein n=1 Tax=Atlantibacter hermannii TaxID=565 RepID=UPI0028ABE319|nr:hypothetical protein [Atlantibacter hermannii]
MKKNYITAICVILSCCLTLYILTGFFAIFEDKGPLSALIGSVASLLTCFIAIRAILIAKQWHIDKVKNGIYEDSRDFLRLLNSSLAISSFLKKNIEYRVEYLNYLYESKKEIDVKTLAFEQISDFLKMTYDIRYNTYESIFHTMPYQYYVREEYYNYVQTFILEFSGFMGSLETPITFSNNRFILSPNIIDKYNSLFGDESKEMINSLASCRVTDFINLAEMAKDIINGNSKRNH